MNNTASHISPLDSFSWQRVLLMAGFYRRPIIWQTIIYVVITILCFTACVLTLSIDYGFMRAYQLMSFVMGTAVIFGCYIFSRRDDTLMRQLPVSPAEKMTFYMGYSLLYLPLLTQGLWYVMCLCGGMIQGHTDLLRQSYLILLQSSLGYYDTRFESILPIISSVIQTVCWIIILLWVVLCTRPHHRVLRMVLIYFGVNFCFGLISGIIGVYFGLRHMDISHCVDQTYATKTLVDMLLPLTWIITGVQLVAIVVFTYAIWVRFKRK